MSSYLMLLYFVVGIGNITNENTLILGLTISLLSLLVFSGSILYVREQKKKLFNNIIQIFRTYFFIY